MDIVKNSDFVKTFLPADKHEIVFEFERATKRTYRYQEITCDSPQIVGTLYVQQWALNGQPNKIKVIIEVSKEE